MNIESVKVVLTTMPKTFDSHAFIKNYIRLYEKEYVGMLQAHKEASEIFKTVHAEIGRFLSDNADALQIRKTDRGQSENAKGYNSDNQKWEKR